MRNAEGTWAREEFGTVEVGDSRRAVRLINMATRVAETPAGKISEVFREDRERQGAYDLLESGKVSVDALLSAMGDATGLRAANEPFAYVAVDGASITLTDRAQTKDFGRVGNLDSLRGLKVINALGIDPRGVPLGLFTQVWWTRPPAPVRTGSKKQRRAQKKKSKQQRGSDEKETRHWLQAIEESTAHAQKTGAKLWFQLDREADCQAILMKLTESNHQFTVRGSWNRVIEEADEDGQHLLEWLGKKAPQGAYEVDVPAGPRRTARRARIAVRWGKVVLRLRKDRGIPEQLLEINAVWAQEQRTCPKGEKPLDWLLLTSAEVRSLDDAREVIFGYTLRWRIESFHKTWKTGACNVEETQLRSRQAATVWATLLAAVAARIERLKLLSRSEPDKPASIELDDYEIRALILLKRSIKKKTETIPDTMPTIRHATLWIAELGGYTGGYTGRTTGGPPGAITIRRGLDYLKPAAELLRRLEVEK
jgi:hypothetical protein